MKKTTDPKLSKFFDDISSKDEGDLIRRIKAGEYDKVLNSQTAEDGYTPLIYSIDKHKYELAAEILNQPGVNFNLRNYDGDTALVFLMKRDIIRKQINHTSDLMKKFLSTKSVDINLSDKNGRTPLVWAAILNNVANIEALLDKGAHINQQDKMGRSAIMNANLYDKYAAFHLLVNKGADLNLKNKYGRTPLMSAIGGDKIRMAKDLVKKGVKLSIKDKDGETAYDLAVDCYKNGDSSLLHLLLDHSKNKDWSAVNKVLPKALSIAVAKNDIEFIKVLINKGGVPSKKDVELAKKNNEAEILNLILPKAISDSKSDGWGYMIVVPIMLTFLYIQEPVTSILSSIGPAIIVALSAHYAYKSFTGFRELKQYRGLQKKLDQSKEASSKKAATLVLPEKPRFSYKEEKVDKQELLAGKIKESKVPDYKVQLRDAAKNALAATEKSSEELTKILAKKNLTSTNANAPGSKPAVDIKPGAYQLKNVIT
ncbi:MAG: ankyrin repeat domain-containing protein, partial [Gammaproteobacteria bacterium]|nr:ankyrin repeat domain-containing protein [Gammaproteobacteria bacterium]